MPFDPVDPRQSFPKLEHGIQQYWREEDTFRRSLQLREGCEKFSFYDGPPFATGLPHYGHLLAGTIKDVIPRYQTMRGKYVQRRFGWDCHGLPIENIIEKEHEIKSKQDILAMGIGRFNDLCRASVQRYAKEWRTTVERMGRWVDMDWDYRTMDPDYMESIWWVFKSLYDKNLIYEGHKPMHVCPRCVTPLSNFEVTQGYKEVTDLGATVMFEMKSEKWIMENGGSMYLLAWTTTPWTLPGNLFVAVGSTIEYAFVEYENSTYIVAKERAELIFKDKEYTVKKTVKGKNLVGTHYKPLFPYFVDRYPTSFKVVAGDFVSTDEGTGLVHIAPGFGEDDFQVGKKEKVPLLQHVTMEGKFTEDVTDFAGMDVKPSDDPSKTDRKIADWLEKQGTLFASESYRHTYPHCWRCDSPLLNYATSSWFVKVEENREDMLKANAKTEWVPAHIRDRRFGNWLENARDWAISRNRYWGTPLPVWRSEDGKDIQVIGGRDDLMARHRIRFTKVTCVRHGQAEHNAQRFYQSAIPGVDLTDLGRTQAAAAGEFLSSQNVDIIYSSPLNRALQTAKKISEATGATIIVDERLREVEAREFERRSFDTDDLSIVKLRRQKKLQHGAPESVYHLQGMEPWSEVYDRISSFLDEVLPRHRSDHVVIVSHGDPLMNMKHYFTKEDVFKLSHRTYPTFAAPEHYFWDHNTGTQMDLHMDKIDDVAWAGPATKTNVQATFIRHGQTDWNKDGILQGKEADRELTDVGRSQAVETAKKLKSSKKAFDGVICSNLKRAKQTAAIIAKELGLEVLEETELLAERSCGSYTGTPEDAFLAKFPMVSEHAETGMHYVDMPEGESLSAFLARVSKAYDHILQNYAGKKILVVSHGGTIAAMKCVALNMTYREASAIPLKNGEAFVMAINPRYHRISEVLDCWFESGSMPYAQTHFPFEQQHHMSVPTAPDIGDSGRAAIGESSSDANLPHDALTMPPGFPADFIAEGIDQTRGWFYTLTVLSSALYGLPAFKHCVVNGIVLAEDGRKMSKRLKNYPEPTEVAEKHGADAVRFALMSSPAVRGEDLRFAEKLVEEAVRNVLLPLWNSYSFFVTYANMISFEPVVKPKSSNHPHDRWIKAEVQDLVNRMTEQLDRYDLSATANELHDTIDALTNWYIRLSRRRFAGKGTGAEEWQEADVDFFEEDRIEALTTLYDVLITLSQLLAPFCPFITDAIYLNLVPEKHGSIHLTDWPQTRPLTKEEVTLIQKNRLLRRIASLGLKIRSEQKMKVRTPLAKATVAFPASLLGSVTFSDADITLLQQELNVKLVTFADDPGTLGERFVQVDARKVGPRMGKRVQEIIQAGKRGEFEVMDDGRIVIGDETLSPDEAAIIYRGREGENVAAEAGVVVSLDTSITQELQQEGLARDLIRAIQKLRKEQGYELGERVAIGLDASADAILATHKAMVEEGASVTIGKADGPKHVVEIGDGSLTIYLSPKS